MPLYVQVVNLLQICAYKYKYIIYIPAHANNANKQGAGDLQVSPQKQTTTHPLRKAQAAVDGCPRVDPVCG